MPELPEVQTTVDDLKNRVKNRIIVNVWTDTPQIIKRPHLKDFIKNIKNKKIEKIWRRGKNIIIDLSSGYSLLIHQKLTGHLLFGKWEKRNNKWLPLGGGELAEPVNSFIHFILFLDNGQMVALSDARKFAKVELWKKEELVSVLQELGPEPLEKKFTFEKFKERLRGKKGNIKEVLMDQKVIAGIGNIYSSEALWHSRIHPLTKVKDLSEQELKNLYKAIKEVLKKGIKLKGESFSDYRRPDGSKGEFEIERRVYQREGEKCVRCGALIERLILGQRSAFFCPSCQKRVKK